LSVYPTTKRAHWIYPQLGNTWLLDGTDAQAFVPAGFDPHGAIISSGFVDIPSGIYAKTTHQFRPGLNEIGTTSGRSEPLVTIDPCSVRPTSADGDLISSIATKLARDYDFLAIVIHGSATLDNQTFSDLCEDSQFVPSDDRESHIGVLDNEAILGLQLSDNTNPVKLFVSDRYPNLDTEL
jgi:hypothetical protein